MAALVTITEDEFRRVIESRILEAGGHNECARRLGVPRQLLWSQTKGKRAIGPTLAKALGYKLVTMYEKVQK